jgi:flagellar P-ring protein precursor FlgI
LNAKRKTGHVKRILQLFSALIVMIGIFSPRVAHAEKLRDLCDVSGARDNQLVGYGIVTGLTGTGDDTSVPFTAQSVLSLLRRLGLQVTPTQLRLKNVAAVMVTATLPAFAKAGTKIDINVSSVGNARSLVGGVLVQAVLKGADQRTYAVGQGSLLVGGFEAHGASGSSVKSNTTTSARIPEGAIVEREVAASLVTNGTMKLELRNPGFTVAARISEAVNKKFGANASNALDSGSVLVHVPAEFTNKIVDLVASLEEIDVTPVRRARVVINERTGTIVAGGDVRLSPAAVVHGGLTIVVKETPAVSQPTAAFGRGTTVVVPQTDIQTSEGDKSVTYVPAQPSLSDVASALGSLGLSPRELASVLEALRAAGALEAEVVVQ